MVAGTHQGPTAAEHARLLAQNAALLNLLASNQAELTAARAELAASRAEVREQAAVANTRVGELTARIDDLMQELAKQADRITELLAIARRKKNPKKPSTDQKSAEPPPALDDAARAAFEDRPQPPMLRGALNDRPRPKQRPTGRQPLPAHLPVDESTVHPERCPCGCDAFDWVDEVVEEKLHVVAQHQRVRRTRRKTGRCKACGKRSTAEAPPSPFARSKVSCPWLAWFVVQKFVLLTPLDRLRRFLALQGVPLSKSFFVLQTAMAADLLTAIDGEQWKSLLARDHLASDATGYKVQIPGYGLHHGHMEVYHWGDVVVFQYTAEKGGETQAAKLASFVGTLLVDAESRYNRTAENPNILEANCLAHPRRKLRDAEVVQPVLAAEGGVYLSAMFDAEDQAKEQGLTGAALLEWRLTQTAPITERFRAWMDAVEPTLVDDDPLAKVIRYFGNHWDNLMRFLTDARLPLDNSASEREFQAVAKLRLNSLFAGGTEGAHRAAILLGLAATCKRQGLDYEAYLVWVFDRRGTHRHKYPLSAAELTPAEYKRWLAEQASPTA
jgi:transposase